MMMTKILAATMGLVGLMLFAAPDQLAKPKAMPSTDCAKPSTDCANPLCDCEQCDCGANCDCGTAADAPVVLLTAWRVEVQGGRVDDADDDGAEGAGFIDAPAPQVRLPIPIVLPPAQNCPNGQCPIYPEDKGIDIFGTPQQDPAPAVAASFGLKPGEILMSVDGRPVGQSCPTCPQAAPASAASPSVTWTNQGNGWLASSTCDGSCGNPDCPAKQRQAEAAAIHSNSAHNGPVRIYGSPRDGQGWWFGKRFGRALPAWRARRRGY